jgi:hypothetical protein
MAHILPSQDEARSTTCFPYTDLWIKKATGIYFSSSFCGVCLEFLSMSLERISIWVAGCFGWVCCGKNWLWRLSSRGHLDWGLTNTLVEKKDRSDLGIHWPKPLLAENDGSSMIHNLRKSSEGVYGRDAWKSWLPARLREDHLIHPVPEVLLQASEPH